MESSKVIETSRARHARVFVPTFRKRREIWARKGGGGECARAIGAWRRAHLEEGGRDGRASVGLVREGLPGARDHRVRVVIPVEPRLVPARTDDRAMILGGQRSVSQRKCEIRAVKRAPPVAR